jgi:fatty acid desaturase
MSGAHIAAAVGPGPHTTGGAVPRAWLRDASDARRDLRRTVILTLLVYAVLAAALAGFAPVWIFPLAIPLLYVRLSLAMHELIHARNAARVCWFHRLAMIFDTPFGLGYREHRAIHLLHHRYATTARDPELFQIEGGECRAFANALISPERAAWTWVRRHGASRALRREAALRAAAFACLALLNPLVFLAYWLTLRLCVGTASFVFHHVMHNRDRALGDFALPALPRGTLAIARVLFGAEPVTIVAEHRVHHACAAIRARDLAAYARR